MLNCVLKRLCWIVFFERIVLHCVLKRLCCIVCLRVYLNSKRQAECFWPSSSWIISILNPYFVNTDFQSEDVKVTFSTHVFWLVLAETSAYFMRNIRMYWQKTLQYMRILRISMRLKKKIRMANTSFDVFYVFWPWSRCFISIWKPYFSVAFNQKTFYTRALMFTFWYFTFWNFTCVFN